MADFGVFVWWAKGTPDIYRQVEETLAGQLAPLTAEQKETAKRRGLSEEDYKRSLLYQRLSEERLQRLGTVLGEAAENILSELDSHRLDAVLIDDSEDSWVLRIVTPKGIVRIPVAAEIRDRVISKADAREALKSEIFSRLGRSDAVARR